MGGRASSAVCFIPPICLLLGWEQAGSTNPSATFMRKATIILGPYYVSPNQRAEAYPLFLAANSSAWCKSESTAPSFSNPKNTPLFLAYLLFGSGGFCDELAANVLWIVDKWFGIQSCAGGGGITDFVPVNLRPADSFLRL